MALTAWDTRLYAAAQSQFCLSVTEVYVGACNKGNHDTFGDTSECIEQREQRGYISKSSSTSSRLSSHLSVTNSQTVPNQYVSMTQSLSISSSGENHTTFFSFPLYTDYCRNIRIRMKSKNTDDQVRARCPWNQNLRTCRKVGESLTASDKGESRSPALQDWLERDIDIDFA